MRYLAALGLALRSSVYREAPHIMFACIGASLVYGAAPAQAHQAMSGWTYPLSCCADNDCAQIVPDAVRETAAGYVVTIKPGTHPMWRADRPAPLVLTIPYREAKPSPDGRWHICLNGAGSLLCFFSAQGGS